MEKKRFITPKVEQVGLAVKDLERTASYLSSVLEIDPVQIIERTGPALAYDKRTVAKRRLGFTRIGGVELELIQALEKDSPYYDFIYARGEGLQHIRCSPVSDLDRAISQLKGLGFKVMYYAEYSGDCFAYMESERAIGFVIEIVSKRNR